MMPSPPRVIATLDGTFADFRDKARACMLASVSPDSVDFVQDTPHDRQAPLFGQGATAMVAARGAGLVQSAASVQLPASMQSPASVMGAPAGGALSVPRAYVELSATVALHCDPRRWDVLYRVLYRLCHGEPRLLFIETDEDVRRLRLYEGAVGRDVHKMHAFVRFRRATLPDGRAVFASFYEPDHDVLRRAIPHFVARFGDEAFAIFTPRASAMFDPERACESAGPASEPRSDAAACNAGESGAAAPAAEPRSGAAGSAAEPWAEGAAPGVTFAKGVPDASAAFAAFRSDTAREDEITGHFQAYYRSIFNPARLNERAMRGEMPRRFWGLLPEARAIPELVAGAREREARMLEAGAPPTGARPRGRPRS